MKKKKEHKRVRYFFHHKASGVQATSRVGLPVTGRTSFGCENISRKVLKYEQAKEQKENIVVIRIFCENVKPERIQIRIVESLEMMKGRFFVFYSRKNNLLGFLSIVEN